MTKFGYNIFYVIFLCSNFIMAIISAYHLKRIAHKCSPLYRTSFGLAFEMTLVYTRKDMLLKITKPYCARATVPRFRRPSSHIHICRFCVSWTLKSEAAFLLTGMDIAAFKTLVLGFPFQNDDVFQRHILCWTMPRCRSKCNQSLSK